MTSLNINTKEVKNYNINSNLTNYKNHIRSIVEEKTTKIKRFKYYDYHKQIKTCKQKVSRL